MDQNRKTLIYAGVAVVLALVAWWAAPSRVTPDAFLDQGEPFFPDFTDPNEAISLEIVSFDEATGTARPFKVHFQNGRWTIPSHHDYPADAQDRLARTAAAIISIRKDDFRSDNVSDHEVVGVIDPLNESSPSLTGRGKRVTVRGRNDVVLADLIIGDPVESRNEFKYVRVPDSKRVYAARIDAEISTTFSDWIQTDLLELDKGKIEKIVIDDYAVNEQTRSVDRNDRLTISKEGFTWKADRMPSGKQVDSATIEQVLAALDELSILGVRPKPAGLVEWLQSSSDIRIDQSDAMRLQSMGYYLDRSGNFLSNEGEMYAHTADGVVYRLRFGEVLYGTGLELASGSGQAAASQNGREGRYVFVSAAFDSSRLPEPPEPASESYRDKAPAEYTEEDNAAKRAADRHEAWQERVEAVQTRVNDLNRRYADWFFVIVGDSFDRLKHSRSELIVSGS